MCPRGELLIVGWAAVIAFASERGKAGNLLKGRRAPQMSSVRAIRVELRDGSVELTRCSLGPDLDEALVRAKAEGRPIAFIVCNADIDQIAGRTDVVIDREWKHRSRPLSRVLLGKKHARIPVVRTRYVRFGTLRNGTSDLLLRALEGGDHQVFGIGVDNGLLDAAWAETRDPITSDRAVEEPTTEHTPLRCNQPSEKVEPQAVPQLVKETYCGASKA